MPVRIHKATTAVELDKLFVVLTDKPRSASVTAETDVDLMVLNRDELHQLREDPEVGIQLLRLIGDRLTALTERVASA